MLSCMWKWLTRNRNRYHIEERQNYYGHTNYIVHMSGTGKTLSMHCPDQENAYRPVNLNWYRSDCFSTAFDTIEKAELALQQVIWKSAFQIKVQRKQVMRYKRKIKVPPWGNK